jgi:hypothetical protein
MGFNGDLTGFHGIFHGEFHIVYGGYNDTRNMSLGGRALRALWASPCRYIIRRAPLCAYVVMFLETLF